MPAVDGEKKKIVIGKEGTRQRIPVYACATSTLITF